MHGRGAGKKKQARACVIDSLGRDWDKIEEESRRCGVYVISTDRAPESYLGMGKYGVHSDAATRAKALVWFVASVLRALMLARTRPLCEGEEAPRDARHHPPARRDRGLPRPRDG